MSLLKHIFLLLAHSEGPAEVVRIVRYHAQGGPYN
jgi:hypothetical protein